MDREIKIKKMIYSDIEKIVLETPNDMELGKKIREYYNKVKAIDWDEDHALDLVMNDMVKVLEEE